MLLRLLIFTLFSPLVANFTVSPLLFEIKSDDQQLTSHTLKVQNGEQRATTLELYVRDFTTELNGGEEELSSSSTLRSCADWITLSPAGPFSLEPGEEKLIRMTVLPHEGAQGLYWTKLYVGEVNRPPPLTQSDGQMHMKIFIKQRWEVRVHAHVVGDDQTEATITSMERDENGVLLDVQNIGNTFLRCQGSVEIRNHLGDIIASLPLGREGHFSLYPEAKKKFLAQLPKLAKGDYVALALIDYDEEELIAGELPFSVE